MQNLSTKTFGLKKSSSSEKMKGKVVSFRLRSSSLSVSDAIKYFRYLLVLDQVKKSFVSKAHVELSIFGRD